MPNPPYSGAVLFLSENQDGIEVVVYHWSEITKPGMPIPPVRGFWHDVANAVPAHDYHNHRMCSTRTDLKTKFGAYIDGRFPDTPA